MAPMTPAERQRRYREKLKTENPEKFGRMKKENNERTKKKYVKVKELPDAIKEQKRKKWCEQKKKTNQDSIRSSMEIPVIDQSAEKEKRKVRYLLSEENLKLTARVKNMAKIIKKQRRSSIHRYKIKMDNLQQSLDKLVKELLDTRKLNKDVATGTNDATPYSKTERLLEETMPNIPTPDKNRYEVPVTVPVLEYSSYPAEDADEEIATCNVCNEIIEDGYDFVYYCVECTKMDICETCINNDSHSKHYVLRIPKQKPPEEVTAVISILRAHLVKPTSKDTEPRQEKQKPTNQEPEQNVPDATTPGREPLPWPNEEDAVSVKLEPSLDTDPLMTSSMLNIRQLQSQSESYSDDEDENITNIFVKEEMIESEDEPLIQHPTKRPNDSHETRKILHDEETTTTSVTSHKKRILSDDSEAGPSNKMTCYSTSKDIVKQPSAETSSGDSRVKSVVRKKAAGGSNISLMSMVYDEKKSSQVYTRKSKEPKDKA